MGQQGQPSLTLFCQGCMFSCNLHHLHFQWSDRGPAWVAMVTREWNRYQTKSQRQKVHSGQGNFPVAPARDWTHTLPVMSPVLCHWVGQENNIATNKWFSFSLYFVFVFDRLAVVSVSYYTLPINVCNIVWHPAWVPTFSVPSSYGTNVLMALVCWRTLSDHTLEELELAVQIPCRLKIKIKINPQIFSHKS